MADFLFAELFVQDHQADTYCPLTTWRLADSGITEQMGLAVRLRLRSDVSGKGNYQRVFAYCLVRSIGMEGALAWARDCRWEGVLAEIKSLARLQSS